MARVTDNAQVVVVVAASRISTWDYVMNVESDRIVIPTDLTRLLF